MRMVSVVGAGIVGLLAAYRAVHAGYRVTVIDEGPNPQGLQAFTHTYGATYSGFDARHVSLTETGPWTYASRYDSIIRSSAQAGWNCLAGVETSDAERQWVGEFRRITQDPQAHDDNYITVTELNRAGMAGWAELASQQPGLFTGVRGRRILPILCASADDLAGEHAAEHALDPASVTEMVYALPDEVGLLRPQLAAGVLHGSFCVAGAAYQAKTLCVGLITWLHAHGVSFQWETRVDLDAATVAGMPNGDIIWAAGVSTAAAKWLEQEAVLLQGVAGCWLDIVNPGFSYPFKIYGSEPTNFINVTPVGTRLLLSGGYGWIGERSHGDAVVLTEVLAAHFKQEVAKFFTGGDSSALKGCASAVCVRPALPSGVPIIKKVTSPSNKHQIIICVGHAAGGFTQAPEVSQRAVDLLS